MDENDWFNAARAIGALACLATLNALVLLAFLNSDLDVPRWSIYVLIFIIGALLGIDTLLDMAPVKVKKK